MSYAGGTMQHGMITQAIAQGLAVLQHRIGLAKIPSSKIDETLNIATWNIREFGRRPRLKASLHYIAEIVGQFDLVSIVELRDNLDDLSQVLSFLGPSWDAVFSDYISDPGGNHERIGFVFDRRAVTFTGLASNAEAPRKKVGDEYLPSIDWWRPPFMASFRSGSLDFILLAAHIRWAGADDGVRLPEIEMLADWVKRRTREAFIGDKDWLVVGDFNIPNVESPLYKAITARGLEVPKALLGTHGTNLAADKRYDQILHLPQFTEAKMKLGGVLDYYAGGFEDLFPGRALDKRAFTYELSDHLPLWVQLGTAQRGERLDEVVDREHRGQRAAGHG